MVPPKADGVIRGLTPDRRGRVLTASSLAAAVLAALTPWGPWEISLPVDPALTRGVTAIAFDTPAWILVTLFVAAPYLLRQAHASLVVRSRACRTLQLSTRLALVVALAATLADPRIRSGDVTIDDIVVMDVSDSMSPSQRARAREQIAGLLDARERERGRDPGLVGADFGPPSRTFSSVRFGASVTIDRRQDPQQITTTPDEEGGDHSQLALALRTARHLGHPEGRSRITVFSDGQLTGAESERALFELRALTEAGAEVRVVPLEDLPARNVGITDVVFPEGLRVGQRFEARVKLRATHAGSATLSIEGAGRGQKSRQSLPIQLRAGDNEVAITALAGVGGPVAYSLQIRDIELSAGPDNIPDDDTWTEVANVSRRLQVLLISNVGRPPIKSVLDNSDLDVTILEPSAVPSEREALARYDLFILHDVPAARLDRGVQQTMTGLIDAEGTGLLMIGGPRSYGPGGWQGTPIYDALPVRVEGEKRKQTPDLALMLVLDKSGSMSSEDKLDLAKRAARGSARALEPTDQIGVIAFDSRPTVLVRLQPASARLRIRADIQRVRAGGGTNVLPALRESFLQLAGSDAKIKHVIVLSDGQSPVAGVAALVQQMRDANITVSGVGVGSGAGKALLRRIASVGAGRYYFSLDGSDVPSIFQRETREVSKNMIRESKRFARVRKYAQVLRGLRFDASPPLRGITPLSPRRSAEVLLDTTLGEPLLIRGRFGLGRTYAFASDADPRWARAWIRWYGFARFWSQVARDAARPGRDTYGDARLAVLPSESSGSWRVILDVQDGDRYRDELTCAAALIHPSVSEEPERSIPLMLVAPGRYAATIRDVAQVPTLIRATARDGDDATGAVVASATTSVPSLLSRERRGPIPGQRDAWSRAVQRAGAEIVEDPTRSWPTRTQVSEATRSIPCWRTVLWTLVIPLFLLDLAIRRACAARSGRPKKPTARA